MDTIDKIVKTGGSGTADPSHQTTAPVGTRIDSIVGSPKHQTDQAKAMKRYRMRKGKGGYGIALVSLIIAFLVRWLLDSYLDETLPYVTFLIAVVITVWFGGVGASLMAIVLGGLVSNWFFVQPRYAFTVTELLDQAGLVVYLTVSLATVGFIQTWRWAWEKTETMAHDMQKKMMS